MTCLITIGITCYNASQTIERAIKSALLQNWNNIEIIVVDDCSTDNSVLIIEEIIKHISYARLIVHKNNLGPAGARNTILSHAQGEFIAFFDDDDESLSTRLSLQRQCILDYEENVGTSRILCYASGIRIYPNGYKKDLDAIGSRGKIPHGPKMAERLLYFGGDKDCFYGSGTPTCSLMARSDVFKHVGGFDEDFRRIEDIDFAVRCALWNAHFIGTSEKLFIQYATQADDKSYDKNLLAEIQLVKKHQKFLKNKRRYFYALQWPKIRHAHFQRTYLKMFVYLLSLWICHPIAVTRHIMTTGPARLVHERKMNRKVS